MRKTVLLFLGIANSVAAAAASSTQQPCRSSSSSSSSTSILSSNHQQQQQQQKLLLSPRTAVVLDTTFRGGSSSADQEQVNNEDDDNEDEDEDDANKLPTLFRLPEEDTYDRYAACLAATEGLRNMRDRELAKYQKQKGLQGLVHNGLVRLLRRQRGQHEHDSSHNTEEDEARAESNYVVKSTKVIKAMGMSVPQFNQAGREVMANEELKEKVMEQAYLYRLSSSLSLPRVPVTLPPTDRQTIMSRQHNNNNNNNSNSAAIQMFARSMTEIEHLRTDQLQRLQRVLQTPTTLPRGFSLCDPHVLPLLSPKVRAVCEAFPLQAEDIVRKHGLNSDEFNEMLSKTRNDWMFRWKVKQEMTTVSSSSSSSTVHENYEDEDSNE